MSDTPDKVEAEVEANRANVEQTIDAIRDRLSVESLVNDVSRFVGVSDARGTLEAAGRGLNANPLAFGLIGLGLACLATGVTKRSPQRPRRFPYDQAEGDRYPYAARRGYGGSEPSGPGMGERLHGYTDRVRETAASYTGQARDTASSYAQAASGYAETAQHRLHDAQHALHDRYDQARRQAAHVQERATHYMHEQPLVIGAVALAAGAVIAAALPRSSVEDRWIGPGSDQLKREARHAASDLGERAKSAAQAGYAAAVDTARDEGLVPEGGSTLASKVEHVADAAVQGAKDKLEEDRSA